MATDEERTGNGTVETPETDAATPASEADILRAELSDLHDRLNVARAASDDFKEKFLRSSAELANNRRRMTGELERARAAGQDSALLTVMTVFDDLQRALDAALDDNASQIVPGVTAVLANMERDMAAIGVELVGKPGDEFDPELHEALTTLPADAQHPAGTIAQVYQAGFRTGERLIRPARVVVYND